MANNPRRYRIGQHPEYDRLFDFLKVKSPVLNPKSHAVSETRMAMSSPGGLKSLVYAYEGITDPSSEHYGDIQIDGRWRPGVLKGHEMALFKIDADFEKLQGQARRSGKSEPTALPPDLQEQRLKAEARLDVTRSELEHLKRELAKFEAKEESERRSEILYYGPCGSARGDPVRWIDGQNVVRDENDELVIDCVDSPYDKMKVVDYRRHVVEPFRASRNKFTTRFKADRLPPRPEGF
ncbi:MAG: hypothetical protein PHW74_00310 [Desulfobacca sp.]|nr:hypothetical protein [Desulfobacca sp.]